MATLQQRTRRRKIKSRKLMEVSCDLVNAEKKSADIERLAYRYTQKCSVDSSTGSESDDNVEATEETGISIPPEKLFHNMVATLDMAKYFPSVKLIWEIGEERIYRRFVDPYDGDDEELSSNSDCDLDFDDSTVVSLRDPIIEGQARKDHPQQKVILSTSPPKIITSNNSSELLQTTESEPPWFATPNSEMSTSEDTLQPMLVDSDYKLCEEPNSKKKQRQPALEPGEKIRKRLRVI